MAFCSALCPAFLPLAIKIFRIVLAVLLVIMESTSDPRIIARMALRLRHDKLYKERLRDLFITASDVDSAAYHRGIIAELLAEKAVPRWYPYQIDFEDDDICNIVVDERLELGPEGLQKQRTLDMQMIDDWLKQNFPLTPINYQIVRSDLGMDDDATFDFMSAPHIVMVLNNRERPVSLRIHTCFSYAYIFVIV